MKRGFWHQCGDKSQKIVKEQLEQGNGVGVVLSPRDLSFNNAIKYALGYENLGAEVIIDLQFYNPTFSNRWITTYPIDGFRQSITGLRQINNNDRDVFKESLRKINCDLRSSAVLAPALVYETGRNDIIDLNAQLFALAKSVGDNLGIPTYSTVLLGKSATNSETAILNILSSATTLNCDGIYFGYEFIAKRIPSNKDEIKRLGISLLNLACTGKQVLHSFAGPLSLLSFGFGATGTAVGHSQNVWQFTRERWEPPTGEGGGGGAPPRYFSNNLWGTFIYPDELFDERLPQNLRNRLLSQTPFSSSLDASIAYPWDRWTANKHFLYAVGTEIGGLAQHQNPLDCANIASEILNRAVQLGEDILKTGVILGDKTCCYQGNWRVALQETLASNHDDFDYLLLLSGAQ